MDTLSKLLGVNKSEVQHVFDFGQLKPSRSISHLSSNSRASGLRKFVRLNSHGEMSSDDDNDIVCTSQSYNSPISSWSEFNRMGGFPAYKTENNVMSLGMEAHKSKNCYQTEREGPRSSDPRTGILPYQVNTDNMACNNESRGRMFAKSGLPTNGYNNYCRSIPSQRNGGLFKGFQGHHWNVVNQHQGMNVPGAQYNVPIPSHEWHYNNTSQWQGMYPHSHQMAPPGLHLTQANSFPACGHVQMNNIPHLPGPRVGMQYMPVYTVVAGMMPIWFGGVWDYQPLVLQQSQQIANFSYRTPRAAPRKYAIPHRKFTQQSSNTTKSFNVVAELPSSGQAQKNEHCHQVQREASLGNTTKSDSYLPSNNGMLRADVDSSNCDSEIVSSATSAVDKLAKIFNHLDVASSAVESHNNVPRPQVYDNQGTQSVISEMESKRQQELFQEKIIVNDGKDKLTADDKVISGGPKCAFSLVQKMADSSGSKDLVESKPQDKRGHQHAGACHLPQPCKMVFGSLPKLVQRKKKKARPSAEKRRRRKTGRGQVCAERTNTPQISNKKLKTVEQSTTKSDSSQSQADSECSVKKTPCQMSKTVAFILGLDINDDHIEEDAGSDFDDESTPAGIKTSLSFIVGGSDSDFDESDSLDGCSGGTTEADLSGILEGLTPYSDPYNPLNFHVHCSIQSTPIKKCVSAPELIQVAKEEEKLTKELGKRDFSGDVAAQPQLLGKKVQFARDPDLATVYVLEDYPEEYQEARKGPWEYYALDRCRFMNRVEEVDQAIGHVFDSEHRRRIFNERFLLVDN